MDLVLGLSMTSTAVRWVLVEGTTGEGAPIDRGTRDTDATFDANGLLDALLDRAGQSRLHAIGVTWTREAEAAASTVLEALASRGLDNVIVVSEIEAADALASGIADIAGYDDVAVCVVEPDAAVVAVVNADGATAVDRIGRPLDGADAIELTSGVIAMLDLDDRRPDAIFVVGSDDVDVIVSSLGDIAASPVISAAEADLAMARGAALASALAVNTLEAAPVGPRWKSRVGALTSVLVAAVMTFVVSLSVALGLRLTPYSEQPVADAAGEPVASAPSVAQAAPRAPRPVAPRDAMPVVAKTIVVAPPPVVVAAAEPVYEPPAAAPVGPVAPPPAAPPPVYVPPAPVYVPPPPKPRLRDRIIERIPIINRFHEPENPYP
jgi:hypothetical protein